jgi:hypothetical protein
MKEPELLARKWFHAYEEDEGGNAVFRPEGHALPPSRGRDSLDLRQGAAASKSIPGPDDRAKAVARGWSLGKDRVLTLGAPGSKETGIAYDLISVEKDRLVLKRRR